MSGLVRVPTATQKLAVAHESSLMNPLSRGIAFPSDSAFPELQRHEDPFQ